MGRCDNENHKIVVLLHYGERAAAKDVGKATLTSPIKCQFYLTSEPISNCFKFSREQKVPRLTLYLPLGPLALLKQTFSVSEGHLTRKTSSIGQPVLQQFFIDTRVSLEFQ